jgi:dienelactone hydrolase
MLAPTALGNAPDRAQILKRMELVMGPLPGDDRKVALEVKVNGEEKLDDYARKKITYAAVKNDRVPAYLLVPTGFTGKRPAMLCLHQTTAIGKGEPVGLNKNANMHYALELVKRGYVCLVPDYPSFGDYKYDFKKSDFQSGSMKAIWNNMRGVDLLQSLPEVDGERIGVIGHSLGGHNAMFTAAFDSRIKVIVSSCGFCSFHKDDMPSWTGKVYMPRIASEYKNDAKLMPFDFTDVVSAFAPRAFLAVAPMRDNDFAVDGVRDVIKAAMPAYEQLKAAGELQARYPDTAHDFVADERKAAYEFIDQRLKP